ncbi:MAG: dNTP triphosphohydrolase, partial [Limnochordales bacterium]
MRGFPLLDKAQQERWDAARLAPYGTAAMNSRGRRYAEGGSDPRTAFQRDRDRILHSAAFRRLQYKTQVYVFHEGDFYRTRLTHSLEVAQIGAALAHMVGANPDLTWAISLAHDLGHPPFGHGGEDELNRLMADEGGFEHNEQALRIVDELEIRYPDFPGLNLTWEVREGIARHATFFDDPRVPDEFAAWPQPGLEAQLSNLADMIAY